MCFYPVSGLATRSNVSFIDEERMSHEHQTVSDFPFAIAIIHLVVRRLSRGEQAYAEHQPIALTCEQGRELALVMTTDALRQSAESKFGVFFAFREPHGLAAARQKDDPRLQAFSLITNH